MGRKIVFHACAASASRRLRQIQLEKKKNRLQRRQSNGQDFSVATPNHPIPANPQYCRIRFDPRLLGLVTLSWR
jgi:hypothetical protein